VPTALAREVVSSLQPALEHIERMRSRHQVVVEGHLKLGVIDSLQPTLMPRILALARARYPGLTLHTQRGRTSDLTGEVKAGTLDAAVVAQPESSSTHRLAWHPLFRTPLVVIAPPNSVETELHDLFERYEWIRFDRESILGRMAAQFVRSYGLRAHGEMELQSFQSIFAMVNSGLGVSVLTVTDQRLCVGYPVRTLDLGQLAPAMQFSLAMRPSDAERRTNLALQDICEEAVRGRDMVIGKPAVSPTRAANHTRARSAAAPRTKK
jgi:DNA-binding transcriptional LysR family regulator